MKIRNHTFWIFVCLLIGSCNNNTDLASNINARASFPDSVQFSPAGLKVISTFINKKLGTTSTLYGNPLALQATIQNNKNLAGGELFTLVAWKQQPDEHWFGAKIPGDLQSVEILKMKSAGTTVLTDYQRYEGKKLVLQSDTMYKNERIKFILDQRPSVMP